MLDKFSSFDIANKKFQVISMSLQFKDFYDVLKENLENSEEIYASFIDDGPDLFDLLCNVLNAKSIDSFTRLEINAAIAYYVIPLDTISEQYYGPRGYTDDIFLTTYVLRDIADRLGYDFLQNFWKRNDDVESVISRCYQKTLNLLDDEEVESILEYSGLIE